jgi:hypothetical protein
MTERETVANLRRQIAETRHQLGATVEELAGKTDVRGRARARAAEYRDPADAKTDQLRSTAAQAGHTVQEKALHAGHNVQEKALHAGHNVQEKALHAGHTPEHRVPATMRRPMSFAARNPRPVVIVGAAGVVLVAAGLLGRRCMKHSRATTHRPGPAEGVQPAPAPVCAEVTAGTAAPADRGR